MAELDTSTLRPMELWLRPVVYLRFTYMIGTPLLIALFVNPLWIKIALWVLAFTLMMTLLKAWGETVFSVAISLLLVYAFFEWERAPRWVAWIIGIIVVLQIRYMKHYLKQLSKLREKNYDLPSA